MRKWVKHVVAIAGVGLWAVGCGGAKSVESPEGVADHETQNGHAGGAPHEHQGTYACPMHPEVSSDQAGKCSICGMDLVPTKGAPQ